MTKNWMCIAPMPIVFLLSGCGSASLGQSSNAAAIVIAQKFYNHEVAALHTDGSITSRTLRPGGKGRLAVTVGPEVKVQGLPSIVTLSELGDCAKAADGTWWNWNSEKAAQRKFQPPGSESARITGYTIAPYGAAYGLTTGGLIAWSVSVGGSVQRLSQGDDGFLPKLSRMGLIKPQSPVIKVAPADQIYLLHADGTIGALKYEAGDHGLEPVEQSARIEGLDRIHAKDISAYKTEEIDVGVLIDDQGSVWSWGVPATLAESPREHHSGSSPTIPLRKIALPKKAVSVAAGWYTGMAVDADGFVWVWGEMQWKESTDQSDGPDRLAPLRIRGIDNVAQITMPDGNGVGMALRKDGTVWLWSEGMAPTKIFDHVRASGR